MEIRELQKISDELERLSALYEIFDESARLESKAANIEFITSVKYIEAALQPGMRILDLGAGTGRYSLYLAQQGYEVTAVEPVEKHVQAIEKARTDSMNLTVVKGDALGILRSLASESFDIILCFGPLYHIEKSAERAACVRETRRVCSKHGRMYFAFINNDMVITTETMLYNPAFIETGRYNKDTFKVEDFPFVFYTVSGAREFLEQAGVTIEKEVASDGMSELLGEKINQLSEDTYRQWVKYHLYLCEKPEFLGSSNHLLFIAKK
ncbi:MAG: class I SAM-dependent methyltransferase [Firmicutes bacterium]|nr:class I SAM-dependent methyltransferase [Bacillota bacterium]